MSRKNVLIIPSWLSLNGIKGSFFREQADVVSDHFEMRFLYGEEVVYNSIISCIRYIYSLRKQFSFVKEEKGYSKYYLFRYPRFTFLSETLNFKIQKAYYKLFFKLINKSDKYQPCLIHAQCTFNGGLIANHMSKQFGIPYIITEHNLFLLHDLSRDTIIDGVESLKRASKVLVVSNDKARQILMHNIDVDPIVVGNFIDSSFFHYKELEKSRSEVIIMIVGQYSFIKDFPTFFETISILKKKTDLKIKVRCVGFNVWEMGDNSIRIRQLAEKFHLTDIEFFDNVVRSEMNKFYWECDLLVCTSIAEGLPVSVLESLACGRPVFSTRCGGVEDVIHDNNGRIVPLKSSALLANEILKYLNKEIVFDNKAFSEEILAKYSAVPFREKLASIYNSVINKNPAA